MASVNSTQPGSADPAWAAESNAAWVLAVTTVFHAIALIFVGLRMYARAWVVKSIGRDDAFMGCAALCTIGGWINIVFQSQHGLGRHQDMILPADYFLFRQSSFWYSIVATNFAMAFLKLSIALNLLRFSNGTRWYFWGLWGVIGFITLYSVAYFFLQVLHCQPLAAYWDPSIPAKCYSISMYVVLGIVNTAFSVTTDVLLALFPIPIVWRIQLQLRVRIYLVAILSLGYFAVAMGIVKAVYQFRYGGEKDRTFYPGVVLWGFLQINVGIIAACATSLRPLVSKMLNFRTQYGSGPEGNSRSKYSNRPPTIGHYKRKPPRSASHGDYELEDGAGGTVVLDADAADMPRHPRSQSTSSTAKSFYKDSSSEEIIIQGATGPEVEAGAPGPASGGVRKPDVPVQFHRPIKRP